MPQVIETTDDRLFRVLTRCLVGKRVVRIEDVVDELNANFHITTKVHEDEQPQPTSSAHSREN